MRSGTTGTLAGTPPTTRPALHSPPDHFGDPAEGADRRAASPEWNKAHAWHSNQIRHAVGTEVRARFGLEAARTVLGYARSDVTQVYAERDLARAREVAREIG